MWMGTRASWPSSGCRARRRNNSGTSRDSAKPSCVSAPGSRRRGADLLVNHSQAAPPHWWRSQTWSRLNKVLPAWLLERLEVLRPILTALDIQIAALSHELEAAAPPSLPRGLGKLTSVALSREVCDWARFRNRRQVASYTGLCPGEHSSGNKRVQGSVTKHGNPPLRA